QGRGAKLGRFLAHVGGTGGRSWPRNAGDRTDQKARCGDDGAPAGAGSGGVTGVARMERAKSGIVLVSGFSPGFALLNPGHSSYALDPQPRSPGVGGLDRPR